MRITHFTTSDLHKVINELGGKNALSTSGLILLERTDEKGRKIFYYDSTSNIYATLRNLRVNNCDTKLNAIVIEHGLFNDENPCGWRISVSDCAEGLMPSELNWYKFRAILDEKVPYGNDCISNIRGEATPYEVGVAVGCAYSSMIVKDFLEYFDMYATSDTRNKKREHASVAFKWLVDFEKN